MILNEIEKREDINYVIEKRIVGYYVRISIGIGYMSFILKPTINECLKWLENEYLVHGDNFA